MDHKIFFKTVTLTLLITIFRVSFAQTLETPNVILIYADDLGYGDLGCYGAKKIKTPNIDQLAKEGRIFSDAHSPSAVCTPSRYSLLTGEYAWRKGIWDPVFAKSPLIIDPQKPTLAKIFKQSGYNTACIGKWHLGFGKEGIPDWNGELKPGPLELGFDYYFGVPVVNSHPPYVYVENHRVVGLTKEDPLTWKFRSPNPNTIKFEEKISHPVPGQIGFDGGKAAHDLYKDEMIGENLTEKAVGWIRKNAENPFFLYLATTNIHHPFTPGQKFKETSEAGIYGDFVQELDWIVGEVLQTLKEEGISDNTMIIFSSDNGGMLNKGGQEAWDLGHRLNGHLQGFKFDVWEGGHRVPFIIKWANHVPEGDISDQLIGLVDLPMTFAKFLGYPLKPEMFPDSKDISSALFDFPQSPVRDELIVAGRIKNYLGLRQGKWIYIPNQGGGGFGNGLTGIKLSDNINSDITENGDITENAPQEQLYNLALDPRQQNNITTSYPEITSRMRERLAELVKPDLEIGISNK